ncbi:carotenoid biosynthesis protein [Streptomyces sp. Je 1-4]|uniref:carotenoid biosynthesis protein n=1 Tax=Streptomyces TaxID=1883 RepID=UPI0021DB2F6F|nr:MULTISPECIES: carotenoid biosynthesis protein [unclassified Streptomyces]UYB39067.1 carotenoid biosynthesis protein [Streptomyces sp. Je 1-4]UZQ35067.1 carotenoid biosynthesis protein [Streptomyces sp. Je 1-4] [Streptomyces sp. Je 1-4 4N24]UZQ42485.1 carotenoid biosynthesis protein [Streptomyces sp. Je 1-4] [Streptomyces sp. Je 1-4 4N24_ara]
MAASLIDERIHQFYILTIAVVGFSAGPTGSRAASAAALNIGAAKMNQHSNQRGKASAGLALWAVVAVFTLCTLLTPVLPGALADLTFMVPLIVFGAVHGTKRYGWRAVVAFAVITLVVSNIMENLSIITGFPFGHYHYTDGLGAKLFLVPLLIGPAYIAVGYLSWVMGTVLIGPVRRGSRLFNTVAVPAVASFAMVFWDICMDPGMATVQQNWIWEEGGGFFGVPLVNYLGWFLTVYLFFQLFALFLRHRGEATVDVIPLPKSYYYQAIAMYGAVALKYPTRYLADFVSGGSESVMDAAGHTWWTGDINETAALMSIVTMFFVAVLAALQLAQRRPTLPRTDQPDTPALSAAGQRAA